MAIVSRSSNSWVLSLQVFLISIGVLSTAVMLKLAVPAMLEFMGSGVPMLLSSLSSWLTPPYLYVVINGIIITIAASSRFYPKTDEKLEPAKPDVQIYFAVTPASDAVVVNNPAVDVGPELGFDVAAVKNPVETEPDFEGSESSSVKNTVKEEDGEDGFVLSRSTWTPQRTESTEIPTENSFGKEKPLVSVRFGHRKMFKSSPEAGKTLGVAKPKRNDTLESTWKMITAGRPIPLARHLKKSDMWEMHGRHNNAAAGEAFNDNPSSSQSPSPVSVRLRKEPSLSQDELNRRVEAFIKKFNEEMRLQRQESLNQYKEMIRRGAH